MVVIVSGGFGIRLADKLVYVFVVADFLNVVYKLTHHFSFSHLELPAALEMSYVRLFLREHNYFIYFFAR